MSTDGNSELPWLTVAEIIGFAMIAREISNGVIRAHVFGIINNEFCISSDGIRFCRRCHAPLTVLHNVGIVASHSTRDMVKPEKR